MYESLIIRCLLAAIGLAAVWFGCPTRRVSYSPEHSIIAGIIFMCGMFALVAAVFAK